MTVGTLIARLTAVTGPFHREMDGASKKIERLEKTALNASTAIAVGLAAATAAAGVGGVAAIKLAAQWEQAEIAFSTLLRSGEEAKDFLVEMERFAAVTPFELPGIMDASRKLLAFGWNAEAIIPTMTAVGDAVAALGGGEAEISSVVRALGQMRAKGAVAAQEMTRQLAEVGIPAWDYLAETLNTTVPEAMAMVERRAVSASVGISAILQGMTRDFGGAMEIQARTMIGMWSTAKDEMRAVARGIGFYLGEAFNIKGYLSGFIGVMRGWADVVRSAENQAEGFRNLMRMLFPPQTRLAVIALSGAILGTLIPVFNMAAKAIWKATLALAPFMLKGAAIAVTAYLIHDAWTAAGGGIAAVSVFMIRMTAALVGVLGVLSPALRGASQRMFEYANNLAATAKLSRTAAKPIEDQNKTTDKLAGSGTDAAKAQEELGKATEEAAKQAGGNIMAFDQVHRLQEKMAESTASPLDATAGGKFMVEGITMPEINFDLGPLAELGKKWEELSVTLERNQEVLQGVGYVIGGVVMVKIGLLIGKLYTLTAALVTKTSKAVLLWQMHTGAAVSSVTTQIGAFTALIGKWAGLAWAAVKHNASVVGAWLTQKGQALTSLAGQATAFFTLIGNWATLAWAAITSAASVVGAWLTQKGQALASLAAQKPAFLTLIGKWASLAVAATLNAAKMAAAWVIALGPVGWVIATVVALVALIAANWESVRATTQRIWGAVAAFMSSTWEGIRTAAATAWERIRVAIATPIAAVTTWLSQVWGNTRASMGNIWDGISDSATRSWNAIRDTIRNAISAVVADFNSFSSSVSSIFSGIWGSVSGWTNRIVDAIQNMLRWVGLGNAAPTGGTTRTTTSTIAPQLSVPHLAAGGIVRKPTLAMIGEGRHDEAVIPLKRGMGGMGDADAIAAAVYQAVRDAMQAARIEQGGNNAQRQEIVLEVDGVRLGRVVLPSIITEGRRLGMTTLRFEGGSA